MIEVSLYSVPTDSDIHVSMGRCVDRARYNKETMPTSVMDFVKGFLKANIGSIEPALQNADVVSFINSDTVMNTKDFASINYYLLKVGYYVTIFNVTEDEENPTGVSGETAEWNVIDNNFVQNDYPTAVKIIPALGADVVEVLKQVEAQTSFFDDAKFGNIVNPIKDRLDQLENIKKNTGRIEPGLATKIYDILDQLGIRLFLATGE